MYPRILTDQRDLFGGGFPCRAESGPPEKQIVRRMMKRIVLFYQRNGPVLIRLPAAGEWNRWPVPALAQTTARQRPGVPSGNGIGARFMIRSRVTEIRSTKRPPCENRYNTALPASPVCVMSCPVASSTIFNTTNLVSATGKQSLRSSRMQPKSSGRSIPDRKKPRGHPLRNRCRTVFTTVSFKRSDPVRRKILFGTESSISCYHSTSWTSSAVQSCGSTVISSDAGSAGTSGLELPPPRRLSFTLTV